MICAHYANFTSKKTDLGRPNNPLKVTQLGMKVIGLGSTYNLLQN